MIGSVQIFKSGDCGVSAIPALFAFFGEKRAFVHGPRDVFVWAKRILKGRGGFHAREKRFFAEGFIGREVPKNAFLTKFFSFPPLTKGKRYGMLVLLK